MRRTISLLEDFTSEVTSAVFLTKQNRFEKIRWTRDEESYRLLIRKAGTWQNMQSLLEAADCPEPITVSEDATKLRIILEDKAVSKLFTELRHKIRAQPDREIRQQLLNEETTDLHWHVRKHHIFGTSSITAFISCCGEVPDLQTALNVIALLGNNPVPPATWRALMITARNSANFHEATAIISKLPFPDPKILTLYLQCAVKSLQGSEVLINILKTIPKESFQPIHAVITLRHTERLDEIREVQNILYDNDIFNEPQVNEHIIRVLLSEGMVAECEEIASLQPLATVKVHGVLRQRVPDGMEWLTEALIKGGLETNTQPQKERQVQEEDHQFEDKKMVAAVGAGQGALATAVALKGASAAATVPFAGPVAMCSALAGSGPSRDNSTITAASLIGSAAWAGAAIAGTPPVAASAVGSVVSYSTARILSLKKEKQKVPLSTPSSLISLLLQYGTTIYRGCLTEILSTIVASPIPLYVSKSTDTDGGYEVTVTKPSSRSERLVRVTLDAIDKTLRWIEDRTFRVVKDKDVFIFTIYQSSVAEQ